MISSADVPSGDCVLVHSDLTSSVVASPFNKSDEILHAICQFNPCVSTPELSSPDDEYFSGPGDDSGFLENFSLSQTSITSDNAYMATPAAFMLDAQAEETDIVSSSTPPRNSCSSSMHHNLREEVAFPSDAEKLPEPLPPLVSIPQRAGPVKDLVRKETLPPESPGSPVIGVVDLTNQITQVSPYAIGHGGLADIHLAEWTHRSENESGQLETTQVVVKLMRVLTKHDIDGVRAKKRLNREVYVWHRLDHPNIAKLFGTSYHIAGRPAMVMQYYQNGNASEYLEKNPDADRQSLVLDVAEGLRYLHHSVNPHIVHGDLKGSNVLVTEDLRGVVADFGLSTVIESLTGPSGNTTNTVRGSVRWQAPELVLDEESDPELRLGLKSDIWSFGCTVYELLTGRLPFYRRQRDYSVIHDIIRGVKPGRADPVSSPGPEDEIWSVLDECWSADPASRPSIIEIQSRLQFMWIRHR